MSIRTWAAPALAISLTAHAGDITTLGSLGQADFRRLSEDLGAVIAYRAVTPATPLGLVGIDIGIEATDTRIENGSVFARAGAGDRSSIFAPKLHVSKGLPAGFDIGAMVGGASEIGATFFGADLRYAIIDDSLATPAVGLRVAASRASGLGSVNVSTAAVDLVASKQLTALTPYVGAGVVRIDSNPRVGALAEERFNKGRFFGGLNVSLLAANFVLEAEKLGANTSLSAKLGIRF